MGLGKSKDNKAILADADFKKLILDEMATLCKEHKCSGLEKPRDIFITEEPFSVENNLLTPTFKLKRNVVQQYYEKQIKEMYSKLD